MQLKKLGARIRAARYARTTQRFLRLSMAWIAGMSLVILRTYLDARATDPLGSMYRFLPITEYIIAAILLAIGGAFLIERVVRESERI